MRNFAKLKIFTVKDLLWHFPVRYEDFSQIFPIAELEPGQHGTIQGVIQTIKIRRSFHRRMVIVEALITDDSGAIKATWFNQPYLLNILRPGRLANFSGKVTFNEDDLSLSHPIYELVSRVKGQGSSGETRHTGRLVPIYPETRGLTSKGIRFLAQPILKNLEQIPEWLPEEALATASLPEINTALRDVHFPETIDSALRAKKRFSFEELFLLQLLNIRQKLKLAAEKAPSIKTDVEKLKQILGGLPFELTPSQKKSLWEIIQDLEKPHPMNRLLQGDVGSGKTAVAALAALITSRNGFQSVFMAPTEILARQHFETLKKLFRGISAIEQPIVGILTSSSAEVLYENDLETKISKTDFKKKTVVGEIKIIIGTHALIQKDVMFDNLALVVIDEQHRFGIKQRQALLRGQTRTETQTNAEVKFLYEDLTYTIRKCLFEIRKELGLGHKEIIYQRALAEKFKNADLKFEKEKPIPITYNDKKIGIYQPDFIIEDKIILELKALHFIGNTEKRQIWNYVKGSPYKLGLLANFSSTDVEIKRIVYDTARSQRTSALSPRESANKWVPHLLSMSATPIPRTLMLTVFGDLNISTITELPLGRKPIITKIVAPINRSKAYQFIREQIKKGRQAFVICPRIESAEPNPNITKSHELPEQYNSYWGHSDAFGSSGRTKENRFGTFGWNSGFSDRVLEIKSVKEEYEKLSEKIFPDLRVAMLHGRMPGKSPDARSRGRPERRPKAASEKNPTKEKIMKEFKSRNIDILVSTSVVEVGVDIPNASIMMIEGSERFGLAQLYQLRGRVGRGQHQSFCFLFTDSSSKATNDRLKAILEAKNGFELAERDLRIRGPGEFLGQKQTGLPDIAMAGLQDIELIKRSRIVALKLIQNDSNLKRYPLLAKKLNEFKQKIHPE